MAGTSHDIPDNPDGPKWIESITRSVSAQHTYNCSGTRVPGRPAVAGIGLDDDDFGCVPRNS